MYPYLGDFAAGSSVFVPFHTFNSSGASVTITGLAVTDIEVYKGASMTQRASDAGFALVDTDGIDLDGVTGIHGFTIDTSDNTDASFYAAGNDYTVVVSSITADGQTVNFIAARFSIENRVSNVTKISGTAVSTTTAQIGVNVVQISTDATAADNLEAAYDGTGYAGGTIPQQVALTTNSVNAVADQVWDEATSGHVASGSYGQVLVPIRAGTCQAGSSSTSIVLDSGASASDDYYNNQQIKITSGTGAGQSRFISDYVGATKTATVATWGTTPDNTSVFVILPFGSIPGATAPTASEVADAVWDEAASGHTTAGTYGQYLGGEVTRANTAQAGTTSSITLDASASATTNLYRYHRVEIVGGTGAGQVSYITAYNGTSKVATVDPAFAVAPSSDSVFIVRKMGLDAATPAQVADAVWDEARSGHATAGTFGEYVNADTVRLSGDATAADNAEAFFDGTGYAGTNNVIPTVTSVTTVTGNVNGNVGGNVTGSVGSVTGAVGSVTGNVGGNVVGSVASVTGNVGGNVVGSVGSVTAGVTLTNAGIDALFTRQLTESYAADGAAPTVAQALMLIQQTLGDFSISGTTLTVKKLDGSTTAATFTLNDGSAPTALTRSG